MKSIGYEARVFSVRAVEIERARHVVDRDVLQDGPEAPGRCIDFGLCLGAQANHLGVATPFEVEQSVVAPAVLVIPDQATVGIGGKGRLSGPR